MTEQDPSITWHTLRFLVQQQTKDQPASTTDAAESLDENAWIEPIEAVLFDAGALSVTLVDAEDHPLHEPDPGALPLWPSVVIEALFDRPSVMPEVVQALLAHGFVESADQIEVDTVKDQAWTRAWMDRFVPMSFGKRLWVCPTHLEPDPAWPVVIRLDPGLAFGSGTHSTTNLCLQFLDQWSMETDSIGQGLVIDFGCGSGILGIGAALLGATKVVSVDHDPQALVATYENAKANGCEDRMEIMDPATFFEQHRLQKADLVLANILAKPLMELAPTLMNLVAPGGFLVLSGILREQAEEICRAYQALDAHPKMSTDEDWVCLAFAQKPRSHYNERVREIP